MSRPLGSDQKQYEFVAHHCGTDLEDMGAAKVDGSYAQLQKRSRETEDHRSRTEQSSMTFNKMTPHSTHPCRNQGPLCK